MRRWSIIVMLLLCGADAISTGCQQKQEEAPRLSADEGTEKVPPTFALKDLRKIGTFGSRVHLAALSADGKRLALTESLTDELSVWDIATGKKVWTKELQIPYYYGLRFCANDKYLLTGVHGKELSSRITIILDAEQGNVVREVANREPQDIDPTGTILACRYTREKQRIALVEIATGKEREIPQTGREPMYARFLPDGQHLVVARVGQRNLSLWNVRTMRQIWDEHMEPPTILSVTPGGMILTGTERELVVWRKDGRQEQTVKPTPLPELTAKFTLESADDDDLLVTTYYSRGERELVQTTVEARSLRTNARRWMVTSSDVMLRVAYSRPEGVYILAWNGGAPATLYLLPRSSLPK